MSEISKVAAPKGHTHVNVILIHGLGGDLRKTWQCGPDAQQFWPRWLSADVDGVAVYSVGFDASVSRLDGTAMHFTDRAKNILERILADPQLLREKLLLIGHSLGGLVIKQMLRTADSEAHHRPEVAAFVKRVKGIAFLATPHSGSELASLADRLRILVWPSAATKSLVRNDPNLRELNLWYREWVTRSNVSHLVLVETKPMKIFGRVVPPDSSDPGLGPRPVPVDADHVTICKPTSREDEVYVHLRDFVHRNCELFDTSGYKEPSGQIQNFRELYLVSNTGIVPFGGRERDLTTLQRWLEDNKSPSRLLITAPLGRGKSALLVRWTEALRISQKQHGWELVFVPISQRFGTNRPAVFLRLLAMQLAEIADTPLETPPFDPEDYYSERAATLLHKLRATDRRVLVIIDGIDEALDERFSPAFFPRVPRHNLKLVVSARLQAGDADGTGWLSRLDWTKGVEVQPLQLATLDKSGVADVLGKLGLTCSKDDQIVDELWRLTEGGDPLLLGLYAEDLQQLTKRSGDDLADALKILAPGFAAYFQRWLDNERKELPPDKVAIVDRILAILACARGPIEEAQLRYLLQAEGETALPTRASDLLHSVRRFVIGKGTRDNGYVFSHPKFGRYIAESYLPSLMPVMERHFADWGRGIVNNARDGRLAPGDVPPYALQFHPTHLAAINASRGDFCAMLHRHWRTAWNMFEGGDRGFSASIHVAMQRIGPTRTGTNRSESLLWRLRAALCSATVRATGRNFRAELLGLGVSTGQITLPHALHVTELQDVANQPQFLIAIAPWLSDDRFEKLIATVLKEKDEVNRAQQLVQLARSAEGERQYSTALVAFEAATSVCNMYHRFRLLKELRYCPLPKNCIKLVEEAEAGFPALAEEHDPLGLIKSLALKDRSARLAAQLSVARKELVDASQTPPQEYDLYLHSSRLEGKYQAWARICLLQASDSCEEEQRRVYNDVLSKLPKFPDVFHKVGALVGLANYIPSSLRHEFTQLCLEEAKCAESGNNQMHFMTELASSSAPSSDQKSEIVADAVRNAALIKDLPFVVRALAALSTRVPPDKRRHLSTLCELLNRIPYSKQRGDACLEVAPLLPDDQAMQLYSAAVQLLKVAYAPFGHSELNHAIPKLPAPWRKPVFEQEWSRFRTEHEHQLHWVEYTFNARWNHDLWDRKHLEDALKIAESLSEDYQRSCLYADLAPIAARFGSIASLQSWFEAALSMGEPEHRCHTLTGLAPYLPHHMREEAIKQAESAAYSIAEPVRRANALLKLWPLFTGVAANTILSIAAEAANSAPPEGRPSSLLEVAKLQEGPDKDRLVRAAFQAALDTPAAAQLARTAQHLPTPQERMDAVDAWAGTAATVDRGSFLSTVEDVAPVLAEIGGAPLLLDLSDTIIEISEWWP